MDKIRKRLASWKRSYFPKAYPFRYMLSGILKCTFFFSLEPLVWFVRALRSLRGFSYGKELKEKSVIM